MFLYCTSLFVLFTFVYPLETFGDAPHSNTFSELPPPSSIVGHSRKIPNARQLDYAAAAKHRAMLFADKAITFSLMNLHMAKNSGFTRTMLSTNILDTIKMLQLVPQIQADANGGSEVLLKTLKNNLLELKVDGYGQIGEEKVKLSKLIARIEALTTDSEFVLKQIKVNNALGEKNYAQMEELFVYACYYHNLNALLKKYGITVNPVQMNFIYENMIEMNKGQNEAYNKKPMNGNMSPSNLLPYWLKLAIDTLNLEIGKQIKNMGCIESETGLMLEPNSGSPCTRTFNMVLKKQIDDELNKTCASWNLEE